MRSLNQLKPLPMSTHRYSGEVIAANADLDSSPENINSDPYGAWIFKMKPDNAADVAALLDAAGYQAAVDSEAH